MAQPFSPEQRDAIRARLLESARQHIVSDGVKKTSLDMLTSDAGISKSSFYKFYDSKEQLFLTIAAEWSHRSSPAYRRHWKALPGKATKIGQPPWSAPPLKPFISWASAVF